MTTTGFWPVKGKLKEIIDYAENPEKTTELNTTLEYATDPDKTDSRMYISGVNCSRFTAYRDMVAVKKHFGERGKNIAYHGYQSFVEGEVTPEEAHKIGVETARRVWGDRFQVIVTTHLNTENIHNHFVINSVSFKDGKKLRNKIGDHHELSNVSDSVCKEHGKSVLENAPFTSEREKKEPTNITTRHWQFSVSALSFINKKQSIIMTKRKPSTRDGFFLGTVVLNGFEKTNFKTTDIHTYISTVSNRYIGVFERNNIKCIYKLKRIYKSRRKTQWKN